jgi:hypothetical protein
MIAIGHSICRKSSISTETKLPRRCPAARPRCPRIPCQAWRLHGGVDGRSGRSAAFLRRPARAVLRVPAMKPTLSAHHDRLLGYNERVLWGWCASYSWACWTILRARSMISGSPLHRHYRCPMKKSRRISRVPAMMERLARWKPSKAVQAARDFGMSEDEVRSHIDDANRMASEC